MQSKAQKSPLRYPGGKSRAVKYIMPIIPKNVTMLCSPFLGGGSIEIACAARGIKVWAYDSFKPLMDFWKQLIKDPPALAKRVRRYFPLSREKFYSLRKSLTHIVREKDSAAVFFVLNRCSFSGTVLSGGISPGHPRFTLSSIDRLAAFDGSNLSVDCLDFKETFEKYKNSKECFMYLDPPYANDQKLYGRNGDKHVGFGHDGLAETLRQRNRWILSYNDCERVRRLYDSYYFTSPSWTYGLGKSKKSNEVLILSKDIRSVE